MKAEFNDRVGAGAARATVNAKPSNTRFMWLLLFELSVLDEKQTHSSKRRCNCISLACRTKRSLDGNVIDPSMET